LGAPHIRVYFVIIKDVFIFHCPVGAFKPMFLLSFALPGSDPVFTVCTKPLTYGKFAGQAIVVTVLGEEGQVLAPGWHSR